MRALTMLGGMYGLEEDSEHDEIALEYLDRAAAAGHVKAMTHLADFWRDRGNEEKCVYWLQKAVLLDDDYALLHLGYALANGIGVGRDIEAARQLYEKAAKQGNVEAMYYLAMLYAPMYSGQGGSEKIEYWVNNSSKWLEEASKNGYTLATEAYLSIFAKLF